jgi:transcriptional regulator with XRE-family HTH domain
VFGICEHHVVTTAQLLTKALRAKKMRPAHLAEKLSVSRSTVSAWLHGGPGPKISNLKDLADALDIDFDALLATHVQRAA